MNARPLGAGQPVPLAKGTMTLKETKRYTIWVLRLVLVYFAVQVVLFELPIFRDETDPESGRSGMRLRIDAGTGCQYLESSGGGLTPRLGKDTRHIGCR